MLHDAELEQRMQAEFRWGLIGKVVSQLRAESGMSQKAFARRAGVHVNTIERVESGLGSVNLQTFEAICKAANKEPWRIMRRIEDASSQANVLRSKATP